MRFKLLLLIGSIFLAFSIFEFILIKLNIPNRSEIDKIGWNYVDNNISVDSVNQLGFRGRKFQFSKSANEKTIVLLGDSQIESNGLPYDFSLENLLQDRLNRGLDSFNYQCYTLGSSGYGQDQQLLALEEFFKHYHADEVILWFTPENDVWNNIFPTHWPWNGNPKPTFWLENNQLKGPNFNFHEKINFNSNIKSIRLFEIIKWNFFMDDMDDKWESKLPPINETFITKTNNKIYPLIYNSDQEKIAKGKSHFAIFQKEKSKRLEYGIELTHQLLMKIKKLCNQNRANFSIIICEGEFSSNIKDSMYIQEKETNKYYELSKTMYFKNLKEILTGLNYHYFRLNCDWKSISKQDNFHLNHEAQKELSDSLSAFVIKNNSPTPPY